MKEIKKIANGKISRNLKLLKLAVSSGKELVFSNEDNLKDRLKGVLSKESHKLVNELGLMKGSIMKVGQMISLYSSDLLPKELKEVLSQLENKSFYLSWDEISKNIPSNVFEEIEISEKPIAAASLGQVHKGIITETNDEVVLKIQYKGVRKAINNDVKVLKLFIKMADFVPKGNSIDFIFDEVKQMLIQETDYLKEAEFMLKYQSKVGADKRFITPKVYKNFSNDKLIVQDFLSGISLRELEETRITQAQRDKLGEDFFELFLKEIFEWGLIQTDPNPGNYLIIEDGADYKWGLLDFGACKELDDSIQKMYYKLIAAVFEQDFQLFLSLLYEYHYIEKDKPFNQNLFKEYFNALSEPFNNEDYNWGDSNIPDKALKLAPKLIKEISLFRPPQDIVFIDRKIGGVFFILKLLKSNFNPTPLLKKLNIEKSEG